MKNLVTTTTRLSIFIASMLFTSMLFYSCESTESSDSGKVWCDNCMTWHDSQTAQNEADQRPVWCVNCKKFHAPNADE